MRPRPCGQSAAERLSAEAAQGAALALEGVDDVEGGDDRSLGVLGVGHGVTDDVLEENLEDTAGFFVDEAADVLDATTASDTADRGLGDALDVIAKDLAVALDPALPQPTGASGHSWPSFLHLPMECGPCPARGASDGPRYSHLACRADFTTMKGGRACCAAAASG